MHIHINSLYGDAVKVHLISPAMRNLTVQEPLPLENGSYEPQCPECAIF